MSVGWPRLRHVSGLHSDRGAVAEPMLLLTVHGWSIDLAMLQTQPECTKRVWSLACLRQNFIWHMMNVCYIWWKRNHGLPNVRLIFTYPTPTFEQWLFLQKCLLEHECLWLTWISWTYSWGLAWCFNTHVQCFLTRLTYFHLWLSLYYFPGL